MEEDKNLQEQYALLEEERKEDKRKTIVIIILCILIILVTLLGLFFSYSTIGKRDDNTCKVNCSSTGPDGEKYIINIDYKSNGVPLFNLDTDGDGVPDTNLMNKVVNGIKMNVDLDKDGRPDLNVDVDNDGICDLNCDLNKDGKIDYKNDMNIDTTGDGKPNLNIDTNGDGTPDLNIDTTGDGKPDVNVDTDGDGHYDVNIDTDGDGSPDANIVDANGNCTENCIGTLYDNPNLSSLSVSGYSLSPAFDQDKTNYTVIVDSNVVKVNLNAVAINPNSRVVGVGEVELATGNNRVSVTVIAEDGTTKVYNVNIYRRSSEVVISENGESNYEYNVIENNSFIVNYTKDLYARNIIPGWEGSQTFTVTNKSIYTLVYNVNLLDITNTFELEDFRYTLIKDGKTLFENQLAPSTNSKKTIAEKLVIGPGESADFTMYFKFVNQDYPQDEDQGKEYKSKVEIELVSVEATE